MISVAYKRLGKEWIWGQRNYDTAKTKHIRRQRRAESSIFFKISVWVVVVCCCCLQSSVYSLFSSRVLSLSLCSSSNKRIYQVRGHLRTSPKIAVKVEGSLYHRSANGNSGGVGSQQQAASTSSTANILHPACVLNGSFISQTFQILYRNEDVSLSDMAQFRLHVLVDSHKVSTTTTTVSTQLTSLALPAFTIDFFPSLLSFSLSLPLPSSSRRPFSFSAYSSPSLCPLLFRCICACCCF